MASIHRRPGSKYWIAAWRDANGRQYQRSTKTTDHTKAMIFAADMERAFKLADNGSLTAAQARVILDELVKRIDPESTLRMPSVEDYLRDWLASKEAAKSPATAARYKTAIENFLKALGKRARLPLSAVDRRDVQHFVDARLKQGNAPGTVIVDLKTLRAAFARAVKQGLLPVNPALAVDPPRHKAVERGTFTPSEISLLLQHATGEMKTLTMLGYYTGQRLGDCASLRWEAVDFERGTIAFEQSKTGRKVIVPMHSELRAHLEALAGDQPGFVMPSLAPLSAGGNHGLSARFLRLLQSAGIDTGQRQGLGRRRVTCRGFHALRHSFASHLANAGVPPEIRMKLTGHTSDRVHQVYSHHELSTLRAAIEKLPVPK